MSLRIHFWPLADEGDIKMSKEDDMRRLIAETQRLIKGGCGGYLTYTVRDFIMDSPSQFMVMPDIQQRAQYPFTMECAKRFFGPFMKQPFNFAGMITSMVIYDGKENLPNHSYAAGWLYRQTLEEIGQLGRLPDHIGSIHFEFGGTTINPSIRVEAAAKEPRTKWVGDTPYTQCGHCGRWVADETLFETHQCPGCGKRL
jgi:hypothetical protein